MTNLVIPEKSSHWYALDGSPFYEIAMKSKPGEMRRPTVKDARELNLLPSVTNILGVVNKPGLEAWKASQYVLSALTLPMLAGETNDAYAKRVIADAQAEGAAAAQSGANLHDAIQILLSTNSKPDDFEVEVQPVLAGFMRWFKDAHLEPVDLEKCFACPEEGYGGRVDFLGCQDTMPVVLDWKTQETKPGEQFKTYPEWGAQLAAYSHGLGFSGDALLYSAVVSRTEPDRIEVFQYDFKTYWLAFAAARDLFYSALAGHGLKRWME